MPLLHSAECLDRLALRFGREETGAKAKRKGLSKDTRKALFARRLRAGQAERVPPGRFFYARPVSRFTHDSVERVKEATDIVEVISAHTDLRRSGARFTGLCPFHDERTPSFSVDPQEKLYHCFGCGVGGDVIRFVEEREGLSFADAVEAHPMGEQGIRVHRVRLQQRDRAPYVAGRVVEGADQRQLLVVQLPRVEPAAERL